MTPFDLKKFPLQKHFFSNEFSGSTECKAYKRISISPIIFVS